MVYNPLSAYESFLAYGAKTRPAVRSTQQIDISQGLAVGFRGRETNVPVGFCTRLQNLVPRNDGSYLVRPSFFVTDNWVLASHSQAPLAAIPVATFSDGGMLSVQHNIDTGNLTFRRQGFTAGNVATGVKYQFGNAANYGNVSIVPAARPGTDDIYAFEVVFNAGAITVTQHNLDTLLGHKSFLYEDIDVANSKYGRTFALTWKGRSFILAGTGISYSAPLDPGDFTTAAGAGFIPLDSSAPISGAFILQDLMYICTEGEVFVFQYDIDPGTDRQIRTLSKIQCFGALEADNVGYIATKEGLYLVVGNELQPAFIPSDQNHYNQNLTGDNAGTTYPLNTDSVFIPRICGMHKFGDLIVLAGLGFSPDKRFGTPAGNDYRYPAYNISTESWVEWKGPDRFAGGIFCPVNALPVYPGHLTPNYGFPFSHVMQWFPTNVALDSHVAMTGFININQTNRTISMIDDTSTVPASPIMVNVPPFCDIELTILYPETADEVYAIDLSETTNFEVVLLTGRIPFGEPYTWKRLHKYWLEASFYGAGALGDNSYLRWKFFTPGSSATDPSEQSFTRDDYWHDFTDSMVNQTPGHLIPITEAGKTAKFTTAQLLLYWKSPLQFTPFTPVNTEDYEIDVSFLNGINATITHTSEQAHGGTDSAKITVTNVGSEITTDKDTITELTPYTASHWFRAPESLAITTQLRWYSGATPIGVSIPTETIIPANTWTKVTYTALSPATADGVEAIYYPDTIVDSPSFIGATGVGYTSGETSVALAIPGTEIVGDLVLAIMSKYIADTPPAPTSGSGNPWSLLYSSGQSTARVWVYGKILEAGDVGVNVSWDVEADLACIGLLTLRNARKDNIDIEVSINTTSSISYVRTPGNVPLSNADFEVRIAAGWPRGADAPTITFNSETGFSLRVNQKAIPIAADGTALGVYTRTLTSGVNTSALNMDASKPIHPSVGLTTNIAKALPQPFYMDDYEIGIPASATTFDPDTPKWVESGVGRLFAEVTEYKPSHRAI